MTATPSHTGSYTYRVYDPKVKSWAAAASRLILVEVIAKPSSGGGGSSTSCYPLTNGGNCYEAGEYCRDSEHDATGVACDGGPIVCEDNNGWRWEPR